MLYTNHLKVRLSLIIAFITLILAIVINSLVGHYSRLQIQQDQTSLLEQISLTMMSRLDQDMSSRGNEILFLTQRETIKDPNVSNIKKQEILESIRKSYPYYAWIGLTDAQGNILAGTDGNLVGKNVSKRDWFQLGSQGLHFGDAHDAFLLAKLMPKPKWDDLPLRLVDVSAPLLDEKGELLGVVCGHLSLDWAFEARNRIMDQFSKHKMDLVILNKDHKVLMGTPELPSLAVDLGYLKSVQNSEKGKTSQQTESWTDGKSYLTVAIKEVGFEHYPGMDWIVVARKPVDAAFEKAEELSWIIAGVTGFGSFFFVLIIASLVSRELKPLEEISKATENFKKNRLSEPLPTPTGNTELAVLARNLADMVNQLQSNNNELKLASRVFEDSSQGIIITDKHQSIIRINQAFLRITGYSEADVLGQKTSILKSGRQSQEFYKQMWESINSYGRWQGEIWNRQKWGKEYPEWLSINVLYDENNEITHYIGIFDDISEKKAYEQKLVHLANYDQLTDLPNRTLMQHHARSMIEQATINHRQVALIFIDLDKFKHINDSLGHPVGDQVLLETATRFKQEVSPDMILSRWGGDEFVLVVPNADHLLLGQLIKRLLMTLQRPFVIGHNPYHLSMSAGIAIYPQDAQTVEQLLRCADTAMYQAKHEGANLFRFYEGAMHADVSRFMQIDNQLRHSIKHDAEGFRMVYQPQFHTDGKTIVGAEALIRWQNEQLGSVSPGDFIPVAEETGQIVDLGYWIVETVAKHYGMLKRAGVKLVPISINCSARQLLEAGIAQRIHQRFTEHQVPTNHIIIEVTESAVMGNEEMALKTLSELKSMGYSVSVDDFGTGYSCLSYMQKMAPSEVKIDQRFVSSMVDDTDSHSIVMFTHGLAKSMNIHLVAEGVETQAQLNMLKVIGEDIRIQGYLLSKPIEIDRFQAILSTQENMT